MQNFSMKLRYIHVSLRPGPEMLFAHSPVLPVFSERAGRYDMTSCVENFPNFVRISASDERQHQCFMQNGKHFFSYGQFNDAVITSASNVRVSTGYEQESIVL